MKTRIAVLIMLVSAFWLAACATTPTTAPQTATPEPTPPLTEVNIVMGYVPHIQFAPFFVAEKKGYFAQAGIKVKYTWGFEAEGIKAVGANQAEFALLGGDQVLQARAQNIPLVYVANYYNAFPISIFSLKEKNIVTPQDLAGKKVGIPGFYGATYTGWRALLYEANLKDTDVKVQDVAFAQVAAINQNLVDAAAGYTNNEPVQLKMQGKEINVIQVGDYSKLVGIGLVTNEKMITDKPLIVRGVVVALTRAIQDTLANPKDALNLALPNLPEAGGTNLAMTQAIFDATLPLWKNPHVGWVDPVDWAASYKFMKDAEFIKTDFDFTQAYTNKFVP